jgi:hypothetical protein
MPPLQHIPLMGGQMPLVENQVLGEHRAAEQRMCIVSDMP